MLPDLKERIARIIREFHETPLPHVYPRDIPIPTFKRITKAITLVGPRRAGKTSMLYSIMHTLLEQGAEKEDLLFIQCDDERLFDLTAQACSLILEAYHDLYPERKPILFLDEVQTIPGWERFVKRLVEERYMVYLTGSNASLLSSDIATHLRGKAYTLFIPPLSFPEYLTFKNIPYTKTTLRGKQRHALRTAFNAYLTTSGFPEVVLEDMPKLLLDYVETPIHKDLIERYAIREPHILTFIIHYFIRNTARDFSLPRLTAFLKSLGAQPSTSLLARYTTYLEQAFFIRFITPYGKAHAKIIHGRKSYLIDHGYPNVFLPTPDTSRILETIAYNHLTRFFPTISVWKGTYECDFITDDTVFQVTRILDPHNQEREVRGIREAQHKTKRKKAVILTEDQEGSIEDIPLIPLWKWILEQHLSSKSNE